MHFLDRPANHRVARNFFVGAENILRAVVAVDVTGDEIDRNFLLRTMLQKGVRPGSLRGGGASHS
jgi:hypothetical protein